MRLVPTPGVPRPGCVHELFAERAARAPDAAAVLAGEERLTFAEVDARAEALAGLLRAGGAGPETPVALFLEASPELVVGVLAVWKAGGVFVPLDPAYPRERQRFVLEDSGAALLLTVSALRERCPGHAGRVLLLDGDHGDAVPRSRAPAHASSPDHLAYVIYTSGSTGTPKGVAVEHGGLAATLLGSAAAFGFGADDVMPAVASHAFDIWLFETFTVLLAGGAVRLVPRERVRDPEALVGALDDATLLHAVPALMRELAAVAAARGGALPRLRRVFVGGDAVAPELVERMREAFPAAAVHVGYGPTEGTVICAAYAVPDGGGTPGTMVGRPLPGVALHVCDEAGELLPDGAGGELRIGGRGVARGYLGRADATAEKFVPDPFSGEPGARLYRTGDRVRRTGAGDLVFLGRVDRQVKIRGFRIEPGEVEGVLLRHPGVRDAAVVAREDVPGNPRLVGYVVPAAGADAAPAALRAWLAERLPEHLVPSALVALDRLPLTPTGKIDRRALPAPAESPEGEHVAPRTAVEELLAAIWADALGAGRVGVRDDFFELGGHSLLATRVAARAREALGMELPVRAIFDAPTVEALAAEVERARGGAERAGIPAPARRAGPGDAPLSFAQERLWVVDALDTGSPAYNKLLAFRLRGRLDAAALRRALDSLAERHESLRTVFPRVDGRPVQRVLPPRRVPLPVEDLAGLPAGAREARLLRRAGEEARRPFDLAREPQFRGVLLPLGEREHALLLATHHIVTDGWSLAVLFRDLAALYAGGDGPGLPPLPVRYVDYALWQRSWLAGEVLERQLAYWRERLRGAPSLLELPTDRPHPAARSGRGLTLRFALPEATVAGVRALARREGATLFMALAAAWQLLLGRRAGQDDLVVGTPVAGRTHRELEELVGFFVNTLALRGDLSGDPDFRALLARAREATLGAHAHQDVPFERLVEELRVERSPGRNPLFQAMLVLQNTPADELRLPGATLERFEVETGTAKFDLLLEATERGGGLECALEFSTELFDPSTAERIAEQLRVLLARVAAEPGRPVRETDFLPEAERARVLEGWNATRGAYPEACVHHLFAEQAARTPDAVAVAYPGGSLSYSELDARAGRLARRLRGLGVGPDARVGLCLERGPEMMAGVLGILMAGGAYVPLDPAYPAERLSFMLRDSGARVLLTQAELLGRLPEFAGEAVLADAGDAPLSRSRTFALPHLPSPDNLAYVIYTSGSTGRPKGVAMTHRPLVNLLHWQGRDWRGPRAAATLQFATISFDASFHEVFSAWCAGGRVVLIPEELRYDPAGLLATMEREGVERAFMPAVALQHLAEAADARGLLPSRLREVQTAGEQLRVTEPLRRWLRALGAPLHNHYGPSETHVVTAHALQGDPAAWPTLPPIGRPIANTACYVLDGALLPAPVGVPGELYVGGASLARGYLDRPDATAEKFVPEPFSGDAGARMYRTGDRARWLADGTLEFLGRTDAQVKIRGFRIEPGEVEAALEALAGVREAVVAVREDAPGERRLVAYVVPEDGAEVRVAELRERLRERLPEYMVPSVVVALEALPLTPSGKTDRRALPAPGRADAADTFLAPRTPVEEILAGIWAAVLKAERVGVRDDFFALGGHSLVGTQVAARVRDAFRVELPLRALFEAPTVEGLAARVERARAESAGEDGLPLRRAPRDRALPLSFSQQRLWFLDQLEPGNPVYNLARVLRLRRPADVPALRRALAEIVRRHEPLRTVFAEVDGGPAQVVAPAGPVPLPVVDLASLPEGGRGVEALALLSEAVLRPFDLRRGPLLRVLLVREAADRSTLLVCMHHIVSDGWSMGVFFRELAALHEAFAAGLPSPLPEPEVQYADWALWQQRRLTGAVLEEQLGYWTERLAGAPPLLELPADRPRPPVPAGRGATVSRVLPRGDAEALRALARREGATLFMTLLAAFDVLLARWSGQEDVVVGTPTAGRGRRETEGLIGFFVNTLALRVDVAGDPAFRELLARVREAALGAHAHQDLPFERLVEALQPERSLAHTPVFQVVLSAEDAAVLPPALPGGEVGELYLDEEVGDFDLGFRIQERERRAAPPPPLPDGPVRRRHHGAAAGRLRPAPGRRGRGPRPAGPGPPAPARGGAPAPGAVGRGSAARRGGEGADGPAGGGVGPAGAGRGGGRRRRGAALLRRPGGSRRAARAPAAAPRGAARRRRRRPPGARDLDRGRPAGGVEGRGRLPPARPRLPGGPPGLPPGRLRRPAGALRAGPGPSAP